MFGDVYVGAVCLSLAGYAILGKTFASIGVPPLYIGEILLAAGLVALGRSGCGLAAMATPPLACSSY
ncbi:hypothetical protein ACFQWF_13955 [Methylorubrum suomiense]